MESKQCKQCECWNCRWCGTDNCYYDTDKPCRACSGKRNERQHVQDKICTCQRWEKAPKIIMNMRN